MFQSLNISKMQKSSLTSSTDFDFLMKSMQRDKQNVSASFNWVQMNKKKKLTTSLMQKSTSGDYQNIISKVTTFVQITLRLLSQQHFSPALVKQARTLGQYIQAKLPILSNSNFDQNPRLIQLQRQNKQLQQLINSHELANIRMHIKINDQQSSDIQTYKHKLQQAYISYKKLQQKVLAYKTKINDLHNKNSGLVLENSKLTKTIQYLQQLLKKKTNEVHQQSKQSRSTSQYQQLQLVIDQQNTQLQRMCYSLKQIISKHQQKQSLWSQQVIQYKIKIKQLEKKELAKGNVDQINKQDDELWRCLIVQAGVLEKLL